MGNRLTAAEASGASTTWSYDASYQLLSEQRTDSGSMPNNFAVTYAYDAAGNRLYMNDSANGRTTYTHDAAGLTLCVWLRL